MTPDLPLWAAILTSFFLLLGASVTLLGAIGTLRLKNFFDRMHAPTLGVSWGSAAILIASMICFTVMQSRPVIHEFIIGVFLMVTTPVTLILLGRAALYRERNENNESVPPITIVAGSFEIAVQDDDEVTEIKAEEAS